MTKVTHLTVEDGGGQNKRRIHLREISGDSDAPLETVGQDLRAARQRRGDDLSTVSKALKIRKDHLEALEEDRIEALPGRTYAVGFVRTYAEYLGLDAPQAVERFKSQIAGRTDDQTPTITVIDEDEHRRLPQGWKIILAFVLLACAYGAYYLISNDKIAAPPVAAVPQAAITPKATPPKQVVKIEPLPQPAAPTTTGAPNTATPAPGTTPATTTPDATQQAAIPPGKVYGLQNKAARVVLRVKQPTQVLVQGGDGKVFINRALNAGDSYMVPDQVGLMLTAGNGGAVEIDLDGTSMGLAGKTGQVGDAVSLDPQAIADRYNGKGDVR